MSLLNSKDFHRLIELLRSLPDFDNPRDRRRLVNAALEGSPRASTILGQIDFDGGSLSAAVGVVTALDRFGQVAYGKQALGVFLAYVQGLCGLEQADFIAGLFAAYPALQASQAKREPPLRDWHGRESPRDTREKIFGENTLRDIAYLELALQAAKAVVRVFLPGDGGGSGFMVAPNLLLTACHVIRNEVQAQAASFWFNYELDPAGNPRQTHTAKAEADGWFHSHPSLDYTILELVAPPDFGPPLHLRPLMPDTGQRVSIIQHPAGHLKKISMQNNFVAYADRQTLQYTTATLKGSSGSPVFNDVFDVIALHTNGGELNDPNTGLKENRNAGTSMVAVLEDLKANAPQIYAQISRS